MAEVDPSYIAHAEEQTQGPDNLEMSLEHGLGQNLEQIVEQNSLQIAEQNLDQVLDQSLDQNHDQNLEQSAEQDLQQDPELQQRQEHGNDTVPEGTEKKWPGWPGESVFRMLVPAQKVGSIIGRKGEFIKKIVEETRARIKILDGPAGTAERAVMVSGKEEPDSSVPPAVDGLLRVHKRIIDGLDSDGSNAAPAPGTKVSTRLLVPASQAGSLIGKQGATVKSIQETSSCIVRVLAAGCFSGPFLTFAIAPSRIEETALVNEFNRISAL